MKLCESDACLSYLSKPFTDVMQKFTCVSLNRFPIIHQLALAASLGSVHVMGEQPLRL